MRSLKITGCYEHTKSPIRTSCMTLAAVGAPDGVIIDRLLSERRLGRGAIITPLPQLVGSMQRAQRMARRARLPAGSPAAA